MKKGGPVELAVHPGLERRPLGGSGESRQCGFGGAHAALAEDSHELGAAEHVGLAGVPGVGGDNG